MTSSSGRRTRASRRETELDRDVAALLTAMALVEIRYLSGKARRESDGSFPGEVLARIRFLANLCHNLPGHTRTPSWRPPRPGVSLSRRERAMSERPMTWTWHTTGPEGRAWMVRHIEQAGLTWTPPPPLPIPRRGPLPLTARQHVSVLLRRWPVRPPAGHPPLPAEARVLKALDTAAVRALYEEAGPDKFVPWLAAHVDPDAVHYLVPDPDPYHWPGAEGGRWQCTVLLRMHDGEQVSSSVDLRPETFTALPSTLPRTKQLRLVHRAHHSERDTGLWGRDHEAVCGPQRCGYRRTDSDPGAAAAPECRRRDQKERKGRVDDVAGDQAEVG